jgi:hypothetical protein
MDGRNNSSPTDTTTRETTMATKTRKTSTKATSKNGTKTTKKAEPARDPGKVVHTPEELELMAKYSGLQVKPDSLHYDADQKKKVLVVFCNYCQKPRSIFSQDAFQIRTCGSKECLKAHRKNK